MPCICCLIKNGPPTAFLLFRPQCTGGVLAGTHWGALRCPGKMASGELGLTRATKHTPSVKHACRGTWTAPTTVYVTFTPFVTSFMPPRSGPSFVVDSSFLLPNSLGMTVTGSSLWDKNVGDIFSDALGNALLSNQLGHLSNFLPNLQNWHNSVVLNNVFGISSVHVTQSLSPASQILLEISSRCQHCSSMWKSR